MRIDADGTVTSTVSTPPPRSVVPKSPGRCRRWPHTPTCGPSSFRASAESGSSARRRGARRDATSAAWSSLTPGSRSTSRRARGAGRSACSRGRRPRLRHGSADLARRDALDSGRQHDPLKHADGAIEVDTSHLTIDEVVDLIAARDPCLRTSSIWAAGRLGSTEPCESSPCSCFGCCSGSRSSVRRTCRRRVASCSPRVLIVRSSTPHSLRHRRHGSCATWGRRRCCNAGARTIPAGGRRLPGRTSDGRPRGAAAVGTDPEIGRPRLGDLSESTRYPGSGRRTDQGGCGLPGLPGRCTDRAHRHRWGGAGVAHRWTVDPASARSWSVNPSSRRREIDGERVKRSTVKAISVQLHESLQDLFDQAQIRAGL